MTCDGAGSLLGAALGYSSAACTSAADGGCTCTGKVLQTGGLGLVSSAPTTNGNHMLDYAQLLGKLCWQRTIPEHIHAADRRSTLNATLQAQTPHSPLIAPAAKSVNRGAGGAGCTGGRQSFDGVTDQPNQQRVDASEIKPGRVRPCLTVLWHDDAGMLCLARMGARWRFMAIYQVSVQLAR